MESHRMQKTAKYFRREIKCTISKSAQEATIPFQTKDDKNTAKKGQGGFHLWVEANNAKVDLD